MTEYIYPNVLHFAILIFTIGNIIQLFLITILFYKVFKIQCILAGFKEAIKYLIPDFPKNLEQIYEQNHSKKKD
jgi:hypothetical protein